MAFFIPLFAIQPLHEQANNCSEITQPEEDLCYHYRNIFFLVEQKTLPTNYKSCKGQLNRKGKQTVLAS